MNLVPTGYKRTVAGIIPEDWQIAYLADICQITTGKVDLNSGNEFGMYPFFTCAKKVSFSNEFAFDMEAILVAGNGDVGTLHYYKGKFQASQRTYVLSNFSVSVAYLLHNLEFRLVMELSKSKVGTTLPHIRLGQLKGFGFPFPPSATERRRIETILSDVEAFLEVKKSILAKKRAIKRGAMQELLTGKHRLPGFPVTPMKRTAIGEIPADWSVVYLGNICEITTGRVDVNSGDELGMYPFFTCAKKVSFSNEFAFDAEAILIAGNGDVGTLHYYKGKFQAYQRTYVLSNFSVSVAYLLHNLEFRLIMELSKGKVGTTLSYIRLEQLKGFGFPCPSSVTERDAIETVLSDMDREIGALDAEIAKLRDIKAGIMQELLTGKIRPKK